MKKSVIVFVALLFFGLIGFVNAQKINLTSCEKLNISNTEYFLLNNISTNQTCFNVTANNITLDLNGFVVNGSSSLLNFYYGVRAINVSNLTILNGSLVNFYLIYPFNCNTHYAGNEVGCRADSRCSWTSGFGGSCAIIMGLKNESSAIYFEGVNNSFMENVNFSNNYYGVYLKTSINNSLEGLTFRENARALTLFYSSYNLFDYFLFENNSLDLFLQTPTVYIHGTELYRNYANIFVNTYIGNYSINQGLQSFLFSFENSSIGKVTFSSEIHTNNVTHNFLDDFLLSDKTVFINTSANSGLNVSANITFYKVNFSGYENIRILKDGELFTGYYNFTPLNAETVTFNVTGFSNYTLIGDLIEEELVEENKGSSLSSGGSSVPSQVVLLTSIPGGETKTLTYGTKMILPFKEENHTIWLRNLNRDKSEITIDIFSVKQTVSLNLNESKEIDLNGDGIVDVKITLLKVYNNSVKVDLKIELISTSVFVDDFSNSLNNKSNCYIQGGVICISGDSCESGKWLNESNGCCLGICGEDLKKEKFSFFWVLMLILLLVLVALSIMWKKKWSYDYRYNRAVKRIRYSSKY